MRMILSLTNPDHRTGFSLVELAIVIVILGLLVGGIVAGQSLVKSAELNRFINTVKQYDSAISSFYNKYNSMPGDMPNATSFWGVAGSCPTGNATIGTCNGDGNGLVEQCWSGCNIREAWFVFEHLKLAGLVDINFRATNGSYISSTSITLPGSNPSSLLRDRSYLYFLYNGPSNILGTAMWMEGLYGRFAHAFIFGTIYAHPANGYVSNKQGIVSAEEMYTIDTKMDDGIPATGRVLAASGYTAYYNSNPEACIGNGVWFNNNSPESAPYTVAGANKNACLAAFIYDEER